MMDMDERSFAERTVQRDLNTHFGVDVVEATANGVWIEKRRTRDGRLLKNRRLAFISVSILEGLVDEIERLRAEKAEG